MKMNNLSFAAIAAAWVLVSGIASGQSFPGGGGSSGSSATPNQRYRTVGITIDGGGSAPSAGVKGYFQVPFSGTIVSATLISNASGSCVVDVWKSNAAVPTISNTITASDLPTLSSAQYEQDTTLTGWTTTVSANDVFGFNLNSASTLTRVTLELTIEAN
jgi:hypothetical protein